MWSSGETRSMFRRLMMVGYKQLRMALELNSATFHRTLTPTCELTGWLDG